MDLLAKVRFDDEDDYRRHLAELVKRAGYFAYQLMQGEGGCSHRFSEDALQRYGEAIAQICVDLLEHGEVEPVHHGSRLSSPDFQRFMAQLTGPDAQRRARLSEAMRRSWRRRRRGGKS